MAPRKGKTQGGSKKKAEKFTAPEENHTENLVEEHISPEQNNQGNMKKKPRGGASKKKAVEEPVVSEEKTEVDSDKESNFSAEDESDSAEKSKKTSGKGKKASDSKKRSRSNSKDQGESSNKRTKQSPSKSSRSKIPDVSQMEFDNDSKSANGKNWNVKISSWNINGIRAWLEKNGQSYISHENPDIFCIQETKCSDDKLPKEIKDYEGYHCYWLSGDKDGYSGVGVMSKVKPKNVRYGIGEQEHDNEGRVITAEFEKFYLVNCYVPNAGRGLVRLDYRMKWDKDFRKYLKKLDAKKRVILCGDLNVAHQEIDLKNPKTNKKNAGFTPEERDGFTKLLEEGFVDSFRHLYPDVTDAYTFWSYMFNARAKNVGWRLDYFVISKELESNLCDCAIRKDVLGSDHCPLTLFLESDS